MGFWEIVLIVACVAIVGGVVLARVLRKKNSSDCGGSCGCCPYCSSCSSHADDDTATHD